VLPPRQLTTTLHGVALENTLSGNKLAGIQSRLIAIVSVMAA
jgi:hypothetical protein